MEKVTIYRYLGTNGVIDSPVHIEDAYYVRMVRLIADPDKILSNGKMRTSQVLIPEEELDQWYEMKRS